MNTTSLLFETNDSYGIDDVMTRAEHRGKGLGSDMFHYLLTQTENKQKCVILQASADGKNDLPACRLPTNRQNGRL
ncbi:MULTISPECIES: GNAT family N-acetyltransferase [unclassified Bacillus (in: firmicutes)]